MVLWDCLILVNKNRITRTYFGAIFTINCFFLSKAQFINMPMMWMCLFLSSSSSFFYFFYFCVCVCARVRPSLQSFLTTAIFFFRYVIMCIHFLQQRRPAILPCLQVCVNLVMWQAWKTSVIPHFLTNMLLLSCSVCCKSVLTHKIMPFNIYIY
jgi:hypothetical protein